MDKTNNIAMLIDGDNAQASFLKNMIEETSKYGKITIKRIYGDWSSRLMTGWKEQLSTYAIKPIQKFAYTKGKNSTDIALIIDAMDILHRENIDGFCIVSSDSDFTGLANRIRENGTFVMGIGRKQTPKAFINACDIFTFTENFENKPETYPIVNIALLQRAYNMAEKENGTADLSHVAQSVRKLDSSFDTRTYGFKNYHKMFLSLNNYFDVIDKENSSIIIKDK